jgi:hypothetical protein
MDNNINMKKLSHGYAISKDYEKLFELIKTQRVVCFVNAYGKDEDEYQLQDVCQSQVYSYDDRADIGARGIGYINAFNYGSYSVKEDFIQQCTQSNLEYIVPNK